MRSVKAKILGLIPTLLICGAATGVVVMHGERAEWNTDNMVYADATESANDGIEFELTGDKSIFSEDTVREALQDKESDISGLTQLDKLDMGLKTENGSDTDGDGFTDKEEIEIYGSDPLKVSTADDLYTDKYKVEHGMDINTYYEYTEEITFPLNKCPEIVLTATKAEDLGASVKTYNVEWDGVLKEITDATRHTDGITVDGEYILDNYSGVLAIDLTKIDKEIDKDKIVIYSCDWTGDNVKAESYSIDGDIVTLDDEIQSNASTVIILAER